MPRVGKNVFPLIEEKKNKEKKPLRHYDHLLDLLDEVAERFEHIPALMRTHEEGFSRISFTEFRAMAFGVAESLRAEGIVEGDRVFLSAENHPIGPYILGLFLWGLLLFLWMCINSQQAIIIEDSADARWLFLTRLLPALDS